MIVAEHFAFVVGIDTHARGGDRQLNKAVDTIALIRINRDPDTRNYVAKRTSQGRTKKEIIRSLKRYITHQIYRTLNQTSAALTG